MDEGTSPGEWLSRFVYWHWKIIVALSVIGLVAGGAYGFLRVQTWTATAGLVTGTYTLPATISNQAAVSTAGPLGLELSADTQAQIIASPSIVSIAAAALGDRAGDPATFLSGVSASVVTENSFSVTATGSSARQAVDRANAVAKAYLSYRQNKGRSELYTIAREAYADAQSNTQAAAVLQQQITAAQRDGSGSLGSLVQRQQGLLGAASDASSRAAQINVAARAFDGGGAVPRPATVASASSSASPLRWTAFGLLGGLIVGCVAALVAERLSDRLRTDADIFAAAGVPVLLDLTPHPRLRLRHARVAANALELGDAPGLAARAIERRREDDDADGRDVVIRPLTRRSSNVYSVISLAKGYTAIGHDVAIVAGKVDQSELRTGAERLGVVLRSLSDSDERGRGRNGDATRPMRFGIVARASIGGGGREPARGESTTGQDSAPLSIYFARAETQRQQSVAMPRTGAAVFVVARGVDRARVLRHASDLLRNAGLTPAGVVVVPASAVRGARSGDSHKWVASRLDDAEVVDPVPPRRTRDEKFADSDEKQASTVAIGRDRRRSGRR